jgi:PAS domain-containing protein
MPHFMEPAELPVRELIEEFNWGRTPLGRRAQWPASLKTILQVVLTSPFPMFIVWGHDRRLIYNDSYVQILGDLHPAALGRPFFDVWPDVQDTVEPIIADALAGRGSYFENLEVELRRYSRLEQAWFTFSYSPIFDEGGSIPGALCVCVETTAQIRAEHRLSGERERLRKMFNQAPGFIAVLDGPDHVFSMANAAYFQLVGRDDIMGKTVAAALPEVAEQGFIELLDSVYKTGEPFVGRATPVRLVRSGATGEERFVDFVFQPDGGSGRRSLRHFRSGS